MLYYNQEVGENIKELVLPPKNPKERVDDK